MMASLVILLAFFNGFLIVTSRVINARLGLYVSGAGASFWNHVVGFLFLVPIVPFLATGGDSNLGQVPFYLFLGGLIGAGYVAISSLVVPKIGATTATVLVIAGQIVLGTIIDAASGKISNLGITVIGVSLVVLGMWVGNRQKADNAEVRKPKLDPCQQLLNQSAR